MAKKKTKYYVVWIGQNPGIYSSWQETQEQIKNYPGAKYKSFTTYETAQDAYESGPDFETKSKTKPPKLITDLPIRLDSIAVDAACSGNPGVMEYRGVITTTGTEIFRQGPFQSATNNIGEFLAIVHGLAILKNKKDAKTIIYSDSRTAIAWVRRKKANTKMSRNSKNHKLFELIFRAETWLNENNYSNEIVKWDTENWGEIPADFGRK